MTTGLEQGGGGRGVGVGTDTLRSTNGDNEHCLRLKKRSLEARAGGIRTDGQTNKHGQIDRHK